MINESLGVGGDFIITKRDNKTKEIKSEKLIRNRITDLAISKMINALDGIDPDLQIKYLAIGTSANPINDSDTQLGNEIFRTQFLNSDLTAFNEFTTNFSVLDYEAVATWEEIAIFCGSSATSSPNSGTMLTRILFHDEKTSLEEISIIRIDRRTRV